MSMLALFLTVCTLQTVADHQAIVHVASDFARHVKSRDVSKMAECIRLVCTLEHPEWEKEKPAFNRPSHQQYALHHCQFVLAFQDCAQILISKFNFNYNKQVPRSEGAYPIESDIATWIDSIKHAGFICRADVNGDRCYEYRIKNDGKAMNQRFVQIKGKWYLGSCPFSDMSEWDSCRNDPAAYAITDLALTQLPEFFRTASKMAEEGKSKAEVIKYLQDHNLLPRAEIGGSLPMPPAAPAVVPASNGSRSTTANHNRCDLLTSLAGMSKY